MMNKLKKTLGSSIALWSAYNKSMTGKEIQSLADYLVPKVEAEIVERETKAMLRGEERGYRDGFAEAKNETQQILNYQANYINTLNREKEAGRE